MKYPALGNAKPLVPSEIQSAETTDYLPVGMLALRNGRIDKHLFDEGYSQASEFPSNGTPTYHYYLKDHQGNVRVVFKQNDTVEQRNDYYPSGALMATSTGGSVQPYKYNGKELERTAGLDLYDYGARWMDSKIGARFTTIDPMCEKYYHVSPYILSWRSD